MCMELFWAGMAWCAGSNWADDIDLAQSRSPDGEHRPPVAGVVSSIVAAAVVAVGGGGRGNGAERAAKHVVMVAINNWQASKTSSAPTTVKCLAIVGRAHMRSCRLLIEE